MEGKERQGVIPKALIQQDVGSEARVLHMNNTEECHKYPLTPTE